jgi:hypothetical protein
VSSPEELCLLSSRLLVKEILPYSRLWRKKSHLLFSAKGGCMVTKKLTLPGLVGQSKKHVNQGI